MPGLLTFDVESEPLLRRLEDVSRNRSTRFRSRLTREVAGSVLQAVIERQPVETGRTKRAWEEALGQLFGAVFNSDSAAGSRRYGEDGSGEGSAEVIESQHETECAFVNRVDYVVYVEDGTRRMRPRLMVKRSLAEGEGFVARHAPPIFAEEIA